MASWSRPRAGQGSPPSCASASRFSAPTSPEAKSLSDLRVSGLVKRYGKVTALDGLSFDVAAGEFFCLLGPSAAGKTTTLRAISGLEKLAAGRIHFAGRDIT